MEYLSWKKGEVVLDRYKLIKDFAGQKGIFWKTIDIHNNSPKGIKIIKADSIKESELIKYARETYISLLVPPHPNLAKFYSSIIRDRNIINVVEVIPGKTLLKYYQQDSLKLEEKIFFTFIIQIIIQILEAVIYLDDIFENYKDILQYESFYHGDLHAENVIITEDGRAVLIDWGQAYRREGWEKIFPPTAPEFHRSSPYKDYRGNKIDVFSLGVMAWNMFEGTIPFGKGPYMNNQEFDIDAVADDKINKASKLPGDLHDVIKKMLTCNPAKRLNPDEALGYFKGLFKKHNPGKEQNCFLYLKKSHQPVKEEVSAAAASLLEISKLIKNNGDKENLKTRAQICELSVRIINENSFLFDAAEVEAIRKSYLSYLDSEGLWPAIAEDRKRFTINFYKISREDICLIHRELEGLICRYLYIYGGKIDKTYREFKEMYNKSRLKHYYHQEIIVVISKFVLEEEKRNRELLNLLFYICDNAEEKEFIFAFYFDYLNKIKLKEAFNQVDLQVIKLLVHLSDRMVGAKKKITKENSPYLLVLVKFLEWGYKKASTGNEHLKNHFRDIFNRYFKFLKKNQEYIKEDGARDGIMVHYISFILTYMDIEAKNLPGKTFSNLIQRTSFLQEVSRCRYVDFELYRHFRQVYSKLRRNFKTDSNQYRKLVLFAAAFPSIINDDFTRFLQVLKIEKRITVRNVGIVSGIFETMDFNTALREIESLDISPLSKKTIRLYLELKYGAVIDAHEYEGLLHTNREKGKSVEGILAIYLAAEYLRNNDLDSFTALYKRLIEHNSDEIVLFIEDLHFHHILFLVNAGKVGEAKEKILNLFKDGAIVKKNNVVKAFRLYYLLIEILNKENQYYDQIIYLQDLKSISPRLLEAVSGDRIDTIYDKCLEQI
jgi:serine/threonine protein kinase